MTAIGTITKHQRRALELLALNRFRRTSQGWITTDGSFVELPTMKSLRRRGLAICSKDLLSCRITDAGLKELAA